LTPQQRIDFSHGAGVQYDPSQMARDRSETSGVPFGGPGTTPQANPTGGGINFNPAAPPAAPPTWQPDSGYNDAVALAKRRFEGTIGDLDTEGRQTEFEYGFNDPTNPFSRVNEAKRDFLTKGKQITGGLANRGNLYSGVHQARLDVNRRNEDKNMAAMRAAYQARLDSIRSRRTGAQTTREEEELRARIESMGRQGVS
jgi:hypothetical protein